LSRDVIFTTKTSRFGGNRQNGQKDLVETGKTPQKNLVETNFFYIFVPKS
jgi:hypothetical protein